MAKRLTTNEFIEKAIAVHGDRYGYDLVEYVTAHTKVEIVCPKHGIFEQTPTSHLGEHGCPHCTGNAKLTTKEFITKAKKVHGERYDYSRVEYLNTRIKVKIICPEHGIFEQPPTSHLDGNGCPHCTGNAKSTTKEFITKAKKVHGERYQYDLVKYQRIHKKVKIICPEHGVWEQRAGSHIQGAGCPKCSYETLNHGWRYSDWEEAGKNSENFDSFKVYVIWIFDNDEEFYKIGRTFLTTSERFKWLPYVYEVVKEYRGPAREICELEAKLHNDHKEFKYIPKKDFGGKNECFSRLVL